jgi:hypothetical protein
VKLLFLSTVQIPSTFWFSVALIKILLIWIIMLRAYGLTMFPCHSCSAIYSIIIRCHLCLCAKGWLALSGDHLNCLWNDYSNCSSGLWKAHFVLLIYELPVASFLVGWVLLLGVRWTSYCNYLTWSNHQAVYQQKQWQACYGGWMSWLWTLLQTR